MATPQKLPDSVMNKFLKTPKKRLEFFRKVLFSRHNICSEIEKVINLSRSKNKACPNICALALFCYTEYAGKIMQELEGNKPNNTLRFESFFKKLGSEYEQFLKDNPKAYDIFRCGLCHEYYAKETFIIYMFKNNQDSIGIRRDSKGAYHFIVEKYFEDFKKALTKLRNEVAEKTMYTKYK